MKDIKANEREFRYRMKKGRILPPETESDLRPYKEPLSQVEEGYGYLGTLAQNKVHTHVQCHVCGYFFSDVGIHANKKHGITAKEYKVKFELSPSTSLASDRQREVRRTVNLNVSEEVKQIRLDSMKKAWTKARGGARPKSLERKNREGRCYYQLLDKIQALATKMGRTPTRREFEWEYGSGYVGSVIHTFGSWNEAVKILNLVPNQKGKFLRKLYTDDMVTSMIRRFVIKNGRQPRVSDFGTAGLPSYSVIARTFGGIIQARAVAGFPDADYVHEREEA